MKHKMIYIVTVLIVGVLSVLFLMPRQKIWIHTEVHLTNCVATGIALSGPIMRHDEDNVKQLENSGDGGTGVYCRFSVHSPVQVKVVKGGTILSVHDINPGDKVTIDALSMQEIRLTNR
jgi:hypothetical protein